MRSRPGEHGADLHGAPGSGIKEVEERDFAAVGVARRLEIQVVNSDLDFHERLDRKRLAGRSRRRSAAMVKGCDLVGAAQPRLPVLASQEDAGTLNARGGG